MAQDRKTDGRRDRRKDGQVDGQRQSYIPPPSVRMQGIKIKSEKEHNVFKYNHRFIKT